MCGISGWLSWERPVDAGVLDAMTAALAHRGPDAHGVKILGPMGLGHRRLSIIDTSETNNQPLCDATGKLWIAFNGEIYNFKEIRNELIGRGSTFRTQGDTEVILEAYRHFGIDCLQRLNGMFSFLLWDESAGRLFAARDRLGEKPLFYYELSDGGVIFASEPNALLVHPRVNREVDPDALAQFLTWNYTVGENCLVKGMKRLKPGHFIVAQRNRPLRVESYWDLAPHFSRKRNLTEAAAAEELNALVKEAVEMRMVSDVPLGAFLSGGVDSSSVVSSMTLVSPPQSVKTFCIGFRESSFDESAQAKKVAMLFGADHKERFLSESKETVIKALEWAAREPLADSSFLPTYSLAQFTREHVTVALSGDGGDECFSGYETYVADMLHNMFSWLPSSFVRSSYEFSERFVPVSFNKVSFDYKLKHFLKGLSHPISYAHSSWRMIFDERERLQILNPAIAQHGKDETVYAGVRGLWDKLEGCHYLDRGMYVDIMAWLPDNILTKVDRATMAHSLESRAPFLDHRILEFAASMSPELRMKGTNKKYILKRSQSPRVPDWVMNAKKQGFSSPVSIWLSGMLKDYRNEIFSDGVIKDYFRRDTLLQMLVDHDAERRDHGLKLFGLLCLSLWLKMLKTTPAAKETGSAIPQQPIVVMTPATVPGVAGI